MGFLFIAPQPETLFPHIITGLDSSAVQILGLKFSSLEGAPLTTVAYGPVHN